MFKIFKSPEARAVLAGAIVFAMMITLVSAAVSEPVSVDAEPTVSLTDIAPAPMPMPTI